MSERIRWILVPSVILLALGGVLLLFTYEIIAIDFPVLMEDQRAVEYLEGPHLGVPAEAIPVTQPTYLGGGGVPENPVAADSVSIQRGEVLFSLHCARCAMGRKPKEMDQ